MGNEPTVRRVPEDERVEVVDADGTIVGVVDPRRRCGPPTSGTAAWASSSGVPATVPCSPTAGPLGRTCGPAGGTSPSAASATWARATSTPRVRELAEEAGIEVAPGSLRRLGSGSYEDDAVSIVGTRVRDRACRTVHLRRRRGRGDRVGAGRCARGLGRRPPALSRHDSHPARGWHLLRTIEGPWPDEP